MKEITILNTTIRRDDVGRFCLNDLHSAAGGTAADQPSNWVRLDATHALAEELSNVSEMGSKPLEVKMGRYGGTYAVRELVYAYAMWISPKFHVAVIRAFDAMVRGQVASPPSIPSEHPFVAKFWDAYEQLVERGECMNYSDKPGRIAINLTNLMLAARRHGLPLVARPQLGHVLKTSIRHPFVGHEDQYYRGRRIPRCWIFRQDGLTSDADPAPSRPIEPLSAAPDMVFSQNRQQLAGQCSDIALHVGAAANALAGVSEALRKHAMAPHQAMTLLHSVMRDLGTRLEAVGYDWP